MRVSPTLRRVIALSSSLVGALVGCNDPASPYADRPFCSSHLQLLVAGVATAPTFSWSETCRVWSLRISRSADNVVMWQVGKDDESLDSPVTFGEVPPGAAQGAAPVPLVAGEAYRVLLVQRSNGGRIIVDVPFLSFEVSPPPPEAR